MKITPQMKEEIVEQATQHWGNYGGYAIVGTEKYQNGSWEWEEVDREFIVFMEDLEKIFWKEE